MNTVDFLVGDTQRMPTRSIWGNFPIRDIAEGVTNGVHLFEDFKNFRFSADINAAVAYWANGWEAFGSLGGSLTEGGEVGGSIVLASDGDNEGVWLGTQTKPFQISRDHKTLCFEIRLKVSTITDTKFGFFAGLIDTAALSATVPIAAAGTLADENFVGFHRLEGDGDAVDTVYKADGVTQVTVGTDAIALVADTYVKLGMKYIPSGDGSGNYRLVFYKDGTRLTDSYGVVAAAGTDFPNDVKLGPVFGLLNATGTTPGNLEVDWIAVGQLF